MKFSKLSCAVLSVIVLSACGGGGGSSGSHNNQVEPQPEPQPQPQPIEEAGVVVQDFQFNAFSTPDVADIITGGNFDNNSKTSVCLDTNGDNSCNGENYSVSGTGLTFSDKLEWPEDFDVSGMNIIAYNNNFVYSIPADSGLNGGVVQQSPASVSRSKIFINPVTSISNFKQFSLEDLFVGYTGHKYSNNDFSAQKPFAQIDQDVLTLGDTLVAVMKHARVNNLSNNEIKHKVSGALQSIINAFQNSGTSVSQVVLNVLQYNDYKHLVKEPASDENPDPVTHVNTAPFAEFVFEIGVDGVVSFTNTSRDPDGDKLIYKWNFGDNSESEEQSPVHRYESSGSYNVSLVVTDPLNVSSYAIQEINVKIVGYKPEDWYEFRRGFYGANVEKFCFIPHSEEKFSYVFNSGVSALSSHSVYNPEYNPDLYFGEGTEIETTTRYSSAPEVPTYNGPTLNGIPMTPISGTGCKDLYYVEIGSVADNYIPEDISFNYKTMITTETKRYNYGARPSETRIVTTVAYQKDTYKFTPGKPPFQDNSSLDYTCFVPYIDSYKEYKSNISYFGSDEHPDLPVFIKNSSSVIGQFMPLSFCGVHGVLGKELVYVMDGDSYWGRYPYSWYDRVVDNNLVGKIVNHIFFPPFYPSSSLNYYDNDRDDNMYIFSAPNIINIVNGSVDLALVIADGVNFTNDAVGKFYIGDDPSTAIEFKNGQNVYFGESIEVPEGKDYVETKLTLIYNTATTEYILRKYKSE